MLGTTEKLTKGSIFADQIRMLKLTKNQIKQHLLRTFSIGFLAFGLWYFYQSFSQTSLHEVISSVKQISFGSLIGAVLFSTISFILLTSAELLAFHSIGEKSIANKNILKVSVLAFGISNTLPFGGLAASMIRLRLYSIYKLGAEKIVSIIAFSSVGSWLGFLLLAGLMSIFVELPTAKVIQIEPIAMKAFGVGLLALILTYLFSSLKAFHIKIAQFELRAPTIRIALLQISIALVDWTVVGIALYLLLPAHYEFQFQQYFLVFLFSQILSLVVHVPGGIGILEFLFVSVLLANQQISNDLVASFLVFRFIYYVIPFAISLFFLVRIEFSESQSDLLKGILKIKSFIFSYAPNLASISIFISGTVLLASGATPAIPSRLSFLARHIPEALLSFSYFAASLIGVILLILADGLRKRSSSAWLLTILSLGVAIFFSISKGFDFEEASLLSLFAAGLFLTKDEFFRKSCLTSDSLSPQWLISIGTVVLMISAYAFYSTKGVLDKNLAWWQIDFRSNVPQVQAASFAALVLISLVSLWKLLSPPKKPKAKRRHISISEVHELIGQSSETMTSLVFLGDKKIFLGKDKCSFLMHARQGQSWISMGNPIGQMASFEAIIRDFSLAADAYGGWPVFYQINASYLHVYINLGYRIMKIGEEAKVDLKFFTLEGRDKKTMRNTVSRIEREGFEFSIIDCKNFDTIKNEIEKISNAWLKKNAMKEKGFSLGFFDQNYLKKFDTAILKKNGSIVAFANIWKSANKFELSVDLMRTNEMAPSGAMEYIFIQLMLWGRDQAYRSFNLGMAPLAGLDQSIATKSWQSIGNIVYDIGEYFYNFRGVKAFKDKFSPSWESRYIAFPQGASPAAVVTDVTRLIAKSGRFTAPLEDDISNNLDLEAENEKEAA